MKTRAAVAHRAGAPLTIETVDLEGPRFGEVLVEIKATGVCHTDQVTLSGDDPEGLFPAILGHEGAGIVVDVGPGVTTLKKGDHVIPLYTPECRQCEYCLNPKTNLCQSIRSTQGQGLMPDGSSRFSLDGKPVLHYMGTSTFSNFTVVPEIALAPVMGWTRDAYRLGYGGGYFDRTLAALSPRPFTIGIGFQSARLETIFPQPHDIRLDVILTETGVASA